MQFQNVSERQAGEIWHQAMHRALVDSETSYCLNLQPYVGRIGPRPEQSQGERVVLELTEYLCGSGCHVTGDNFFTSLPLCQSLLRRNLTYNGTLRQNKAYLPSEFLPNRQREAHSSLFGFTETTTIVSYVPKKGRAVNLMSTLHKENRQ